MNKKILGYLSLLLLIAACTNQPKADIERVGAEPEAMTAVPVVEEADIVNEASEPPELPTAEPDPVEPESPPVPSPDAKPAAPEPEPPAEAESSFAGTVPAPDFPPDLDWLNTGRALSLSDLRGKVVLLDFWTYGCINCIHVIPELKRLEEKYADELVVIGVHSAKFATEGETDNIRQIVQRYELEHPIINDKDFVVWQTYGANAWPTFVLIDPEGNVLGFHSGEGIYDLFDQVIAGMVAEFDALNLIDRSPIELELEKENLVNSPLLFPGKVLADAENNRLFIADSNHNRLVVTDLAGQVLAVIGSGEPALVDGDFETAALNRPQGLTLAEENVLYVADTENHAIRRIDLTAETVETVAGNGRHGAYETFEGRGTGVALNSPWDVLYHDAIVYIAMAGQHQLWQYNPENGVVRVFAGSGREELKDGNLLNGGLNQPSGLATDGERLYFADSEASAIRTAHLTNIVEGLQTIVGTGLFDFGDVDGVGEEVRLQHPLGVVYDDGLLYVADTYNNKIKLIDPESRSSSTFLGGETDGWQDGPAPLFDEPGGLSLAGDKLFIADTNNHVIRIADLTTDEVSTLVLVDKEGLLTRRAAGGAFPGEIIQLEPQRLAAGTGSLNLEVNLPPGYKFNELAPFSLEITGGDGLTIAPEAAFIQIVNPTFPLEIPLSFASGETELAADLVIYYCEAESESLCLIEQVRYEIPIVTGADGETVFSLNHEIELPPLSG